jgi:nitrogen fixation protein NifU and related proteins
MHYVSKMSAVQTGQFEALAEEVSPRSSGMLILEQRKGQFQGSEWGYFVPCCAGMSVNLAPMPSIFTVPVVPGIGRKTWNRYCYMSKTQVYFPLSRLWGQEQGDWLREVTAELQWGIVHKGSRQMSELEKLISNLTHKSYGSRNAETGPRQVKFGRLPEATTSARVTGPCGETMEIYLQIEGEEIRDGSFFTDGCGASRLCGSLALMLAIGNNLDDAAMIEGDTLLGMIENLPEDHRHCATLAAGTLQTALHNYVAEPEHRHHLALPSLQK